MALDKFNSIVHVLAQAARPLSPTGVLSGKTFAAKANIATSRAPVDCALRVLDSYTGPFTSTAVRLLEQAGAVCIGTTNMDEFGMGLASTHSSHGAVVNPQYYPANHVAGGSLGGSAACVAAGLADFALGTDTGGSVRQPAAWCGVVGFKPTYGLISRFGVVAYAQLLDTVGILARLVRTTRDVFGVLDKWDDNDVTALPLLVRGRKAKEGPWVVGVPEQMLLGEVGPEALEALELALVGLKKLGHKIVPVLIPALSRLLLAYYTLATAEAASNLARYDGVRYGENEKGHSFGVEVRRRVLSGTYTLSSELGLHYKHATLVREKLVEELNCVFASAHLFVGVGEKHKDVARNGPDSGSGVDVLLAPTVLGRAPERDVYDQITRNFIEGYAGDVPSVPASLAGLPTVSVPFNGVGIQVMAQHGDDATALSVSEAVETIFAQ